MSSSDKAKLDNATANATSSRLVQRDGSGNAQFAQVTATASAPTASNHLTRKDWVEALAAEKIGRLTLGAGANLNTVTDDGVYTQTQNANTSSALNYPANLAGVLWVVTASSIVWQVYQTYTTSAPTLFVRTRYNGSWGAWREQASTDLATTTVAGLMPAADRARLNAATANATGNTLALRDSAGRIKVSTPSATADAATKGYADGLHATAMNDIGAATANATANSLMRRDAGGRTNVGTPTASGHATNRGFVEGLTNPLTARVTATETDLSQASNAHGSGTLVRRNASGQVQLSRLSLTQSPAGINDATTKAYVDDLTDPLTYKSGVRYYDHTTGMITGRITVVRVGTVVTVTFEFSGSLAGSGSSYTAWSTIGPQLPVGIRPLFNAAVNPTGGPSFRIASNGIPYVRTPGSYPNGTTATLTYVVETAPPSTFDWGTAA